MGKYRYTIKNNTVHVTDHENELKVLDFGDWESGKIGYYKSLLAHKRDMEYAEAYLKQMFFSENTSLIDGALINSAIQLLIKCFTNPSDKGRCKLNETKVFRRFAQSIGEEDLTDQFSQFYSARNRVISHDQLDYSQNIIGLVVNPTTGIAEDIANFTIRTGYLYKQNQKILLRMVSITIEYLNDQIDKIKRSLIKRYNEISPKPNLSSIECEDIPMTTAW